VPALESWRQIPVDFIMLEYLHKYCENIKKLDFFFIHNMRPLSIRDNVIPSPGQGGGGCGGSSSGSGNAQPPMGAIYRSANNNYRRILARRAVSAPVPERLAYFGPIAGC